MPRDVIEAHETAAITLRLIIERVRAECGESGLVRLRELARESRSLEEIETAEGWHSLDTRRRFFNAAAELTGDSEFATRVGASFISSKSSVLMRVLLSRFGSPQALLAALPIVQAKFDNAYYAVLMEQRPGFAVIEFVTRPGQEPSPHDCRYTMGLFSQLPILFGLDAAAVSQLECQAEGAEHCIIEIAWNDHPSEPHETALNLVASGSDLLQAQLDSLQTTVADLLDTRDVAEVVQRVMDHVGSAVTAHQVLLALRFEDGETIEVSAQGFDGELAARIASQLLDSSAEVPPWEETNLRWMIVADVASAGRRYGKLAAFSATSFVEGEQELLDSYARLAATALDASIALGVADAGRQSAEVLASFAAKLIRVQDRKAVVAAAIEAARDLVKSDQSCVFEYLEETGALKIVGHLGFDPSLAAALDVLVVTAEDTPELSRTLAAPEIARVYHRDTADEYMSAVMALFDVDSLTSVSIRTADRMFGVLVTAWKPGHRPGDHDELTRRLGAIADQAAGAWEKAILLEQIHRHASADSLTGLANRRVFAETLANLLAGRDGSVAVLFCDVDHFKDVNDALGHAAGDELLVAISRRLQHCVRSDDLVARLGSDEFTVLLADVDDSWNPNIFATRIREALIEPVEVDGSEIVVHLSIGAVTVATGSATVKDVLRSADAAMYAAKSRGGDRLLEFEPAMMAERSARLELEADLAAATSDLGQFELVYQPQVHMATGGIVGVEALVRWRHPERGLLRPADFLGVAEATGLVIPIDLHVLKSALAQVTTWQLLGLDFRVAVNFSAVTLSSPSLVPAIRDALAAAGVEGDRLELELTESTAVSDPEALGAILLSLRDLGVSTAIDDVGTGYSSLTLLHRLPAQRIKIDKSFVDHIVSDSGSRSVVEAVLLLADRLGQTVVAEGVETTDQALELLRLGCNLAQGYLFARPVTAVEVAELSALGISGVRAP